MTTWRYIAQRATTRQFLDYEVPFLTRSELTWSLSAAGYLRGTVSPDSVNLKALDGRPLFEEWNTLIYAEADGQIRWGGIVISSQIASNGESWEVEVATFSTYPNGIPYLGNYYGVQVDPADVARDIWSHIQGFDNGDLGVTVTGSTGVRIGSPSEDRYKADKRTYEGRKAVYETERDSYNTLRAYATERGRVRSAFGDTKTSASKALSTAKRTLSAAKRALSAAKRTLEDAKKLKPPQPDKVAAAQAVVNTATADVAAKTQAVKDAQAYYDRRVDDYNDKVKSYKNADAAADAQAKVRDAAKKDMDNAKSVMDASKKIMDDDGGAYKIPWWDAVDCGDKIKSLADNTPFDYTETHEWNDDKTDVIHRINIQYPRAGRRRDDLVFIQGDNVIALPAPDSNGDSFANSIFALGAGEGSAMKRTTSAVNDGRLRRVEVVSSKNTKTMDDLRAIARSELLRSLANMTIDEIQVVNHPNARIGSWALGDDILVQADVPFLGRLAIWHRIVSWSLTSDSTATLHLARTDSFTYGK